MGLDKTLLVEEVDQQFICGLCDQVLVNPVYAGCNHIFCKSCVTRKLRSRVTKSLCPSCSANLTDNTEDTSIEFKLNLLNLTIECSNRCESTFMLADLPDHLDVCPYAPVVCDFKSKGCKKTVRRQDIMKHLAECDFRTVECEACGHVTMYRELFTHQSRVRCLERKLKQQIIRERKVASQEINRHRQKLYRDTVRLDQHQRKTFTNHYKSLSYRKFSKQQSTYCESEDNESNASPRDHVFLTDDVKQEEDDYQKMEPQLENTRNISSKTPHSSRCDYAMQICAQCDRKFRVETNGPNACRWHVGPMVEVFGGTCFACGRPDYQPGCASGFHKL